MKKLHGMAMSKKFIFSVSVVIFLLLAAFYIVLTFVESLLGSGTVRIWLLFLTLGLGLLVCLALFIQSRKNSRLREELKIFLKKAGRFAGIILLLLALNISIVRPLSGNIEFTVNILLLIGCIIYLFVYWLPTFFRLTKKVHDDLALHELLLARREEHK